jgi:hypothetical protein
MRANNGKTLLMGVLIGLLVVCAAGCGGGTGAFRDANGFVIGATPTPTPSRPVNPAAIKQTAVQADREN